MATHGHAITWGSHAGRRTGGLRWHWLHRLGQWFNGRTARNGGENDRVAQGIWDARRERFQPLTAESALEHAAAHGGQSWSITMHSAAL